MRRISRFSAFLIFGMLATSAASVAFGSELDGTWVQTCQEADESWSTASHVYQGGQATAQYTMFEATGCTKKVLETASEGSFVTTVFEGTSSIDYTISKITLTVFGSDMVSYFNSVKFCGVSNWSSGVGQNVTGKTCQGEVMGGNFYDIWSVEGNALFSGLVDDTHHGKTPQSRPVELDRGTSLIRQ